MSWNYIRADEFCSKVTDGTHDSPKRVDFGKYLITSKHIKGPEIDFESAYYISEEDFEKINQRSKVDQWDVIISMIGAYCGFCYIERNPCVDYAVKNVGLFKTGSKDKAAWLYYYLNSPQGQSYLNLVRAGSSQPYISLGELRKMPIPAPDEETMSRICSVLGTIDLKIQNNTHINQNLLQQAQSLYKSWFVDYLPFDGARPSNWVDGTIDDLAKEIVCGKTPSTKVPEYYGSDIPFITIPDMHGNTYVVETERSLSKYGADSQAKKTLPKNSVCVSCIGTAGLVALVASESQTNQQINSIIPKEDFSPFYIYLLMLTLSDVINSFGQSGSTIVNLNKGLFGKIEVTVPSVAYMKEFDSIVAPLFGLILKNQKENLQLSALRDTLLPKLMSGELDVSDIEL